MSGSPPQIETMGASHSVAEPRQSSRDIMSLRLVEYSRIRPQPVQVKLQVCNGSSCRTMANFGVRSVLCLMMCLAIFAVSARGNRIQDFQFAEATLIGGTGKAGSSAGELVGRPAGSW